MLYLVKTFIYLLFHAEFFSVEKYFLILGPIQFDNTPICDTSL